MVAEKRIDVFVEKKEGRASKSGKDLQMIDLIKLTDKNSGQLVGSEKVICNRR